MKRLILLLLMMLAAFPACGEEAGEARYEARGAIEFHLRPSPESTYFIITVPEDAKLKVYELGEEWSLVQYKAEKGWCKTKWLWGFRSLNAEKYPVPDARPACGVLTALKDVLVSGGDFSGLSVGPGTLLCPVSAGAEGYILPVWRGEATMPADSFRYVPFASYKNTRPGDLIAGYTTYYNEKTGGKLADGRAHNIALGCERISGVTVAPGQEFSFNAVCGPYKQKNGYQMAPNISSDGQGYGGGICQVTTTLYNALLGTPLQITDWAVHRRSGVQYVPQYFDAAVGSYSDLKFVNTLPYSVRIEAMPQSGAVTVLLSRAE